MPSLDKDRPAQVIATDLILENEDSNLLGELSALPVSLSRPHPRVRWGACLGSLDGVGGGTEIVFCHVTYAGGLASGVGSESSRTVQRSSRTHRVTTGGSSRHHAHLAASPCPCGLDRAAGPVVLGFPLRKQVQNMLGAIRGPQGKEPVVGIGERPAAPDRDHPGISNGGKDHGFSIPAG